MVSVSMTFMPEILPLVMIAAVYGQTIMSALA
jgi:hypothetical protein